MRKGIFGFLVVALIIFTLTGCQYAKNTSENLSELYSDRNSMYSDIKASGVSTNHSINSTAETTENIPSVNHIVYDIAGVSDNLNEIQLTNMKKWRDEVKAYGEKYPLEVLINGQPQSNSVYLTFDDGPDSVITPQVVDILAKNNVSGNFFFVGKYVKKYAAVVRKAYDNNNYVGSHCYSHLKLTAMTAAQVKKEITDTGKILKEITGVSPSYVRPPYGDINDAVISDFKALNLKMVLWSIDTLDWSQREASHIVKNVTAHLRPGDIILMHCNSDKKETVKALPEIIKAIKDKGYKCGTFDRLKQ